MKKKLFWAIFLIFLGFSVCYADEEITTINIINALKTDYEKDTETGNENIILEGAVELSVEKGSTKTKITANKVSYDRKTKMLYAEGDVHVTSSGSSAGDEDITASSLILNTSTLEGVFDGGRVIQTQSDAINLPSGSTLVVFSNLFGKSEDNTLAFKNASLTFCDDDDPHWKINASRIWLLPGGEFAFLNALLFVGPVPVLYLPAFYYPKDELVFHPVFGYKHREGFFIQTTTYLYGRKPLETESSSSSSSKSSSDNEDKAADETLDSLYNFMKPSKLKEQKLEGIVLHNLDEDYSGNTSDYFKLQADWYSNLGVMAGFDSNFSFNKIPINKLALNVNLAWSNPIFLDNKNYTNLSPNGQKYWDRSNFLGQELPFRYKANFQFGISKPININLSLPIYSDPFFGYDFDNRSEDLNWISAIKELLDKDDTVETSSIASYTWSLTSSFSPSLPNLFKPFLSSISLNTTSSVNIASLNTDKEEFANTLAERYGVLDDEDEEIDYFDFDKLIELQKKEAILEDVKKIVEVSPERSFYYPSQVTPISGSMNISGTIFSWPFNKPKSESKKEKKNLALSLSKPEDFMNSKEITEQEKQENSDTEEPGTEETDKSDDEKTEEEKSLYEDIVSLPAIPYTVKNENVVSGFNYSLGYSVAPNVSTQINYASIGLKTPSDFDWNKPRSVMYTVKLPTSLKSNFSYGDTFFSIKNDVTYSPIWQDHSYALEIDEEKTNGGYTEKEILSLKRTDLSASTQNIVNTNTVSIKPFVYSPTFKDTGISWDTNLKLYQRKFLADSDVDEPEWDEIWLDWDDKETVTTNQLNLILATNEFDSKFNQSLTLSAALPPLDDKYTAQLTLGFPYVTASFSAGIYKSVTKKSDSTSSSQSSSSSKDKNNDDEEEIEEWKKDPLQQSLSISIPIFKNNLTFSESFNYNLEDDEPHADSFKTSLSWMGLSFAYTMSYVIPYNFEEGVGWVAEEEKDFVPYSLSLTYSTPSKTFYKWKNRISFSPGLSTSIVYDMVRTTNSYLQFSPSLTFKLNEFLDLKFSATSRNSSIVTYFDDRILGFKKNIFTDLFNSFRFDNESLRKSSGFKLKSLNIDLSHELHDWKLKMAFKIEPKLVTRVRNGVARQEYLFDPYIAIGVTWSPMEAIKTNAEHKYDAERIEYEEDGRTKAGKGYYIWELD